MAHAGFQGSCQPICKQATNSPLQACNGGPVKPIFLCVLLQGMAIQCALACVHTCTRAHMHAQDARSTRTPLSLYAAVTEVKGEKDDALCSLWVCVFQGLTHGIDKYDTTSLPSQASCRHPPLLSQPPSLPPLPLDSGS